MPSLNTLNYKKEQIDALQIVREKVSTSFQKLHDETTLITFIIVRSNPGAAAPCRTGGQFIIEESIIHPLPPLSHNTIHPFPPTSGMSTLTPGPSTAEIFTYGQRSPAEETIQKHSSRVPNPTNLPVKEGAGGILYPNREDNLSYISKNPLGFRRCFKCSSETAHEDGFASCPRHRDPTAKAPFFKELWIHKPHTKTKDNPIRNLGTANTERNVSHNIMIINQITSGRSSHSPYRHG